MPLKRQLQLLSAWARYVVLASVLGAAVAFIFSSNATPKYFSEVTILVGPPLGGPLGSDDVQAGRLLRQTFADLAKSRNVLTRASGAAGSDVSLDELSRGVTTRVPPDSSLLAIGLSTTQADDSAAIANAIVDQLRDYLAQTPAAEGSDIELTIVDPAVPATQPTGLGPVLSALIGAAIGLAAVLTVAYLFETLRSREEDDV